jgi:hypothetical protein
MRAMSFCSRVSGVFGEGSGGVVGAAACAVVAAVCGLPLGVVGVGEIESEGPFALEHPSVSAAETQEAARRT